jgi:hypothetical protein
VPLQHHVLPAMNTTQAYKSNDWGETKHLPRRWPSFVRSSGSRQGLPDKQAHDPIQGTLHSLVPIQERYYVQACQTGYSPSILRS